MKQNGKNINQFKTGNIITRIEPSKPIQMPNGDLIKDRKFIGEPLKFLSITNGCVNVEKSIKKKKPIKHDDKKLLDEELVFAVEMATKLLEEMFTNSGLIILPLDVYENGWSLYIDPYMGAKDIVETKEELNDKLEKAIEDENYKLAKQIKEKIINFKK